MTAVAITTTIIIILSSGSMALRDVTASVRMAGGRGVGGWVMGGVSEWSGWSQWLWLRPPLSLGVVSQRSESGHRATKRADIAAAAKQKRRRGNHTHDNT